MKRLMALLLTGVLLVSGCAPAGQKITREERLRFFEFADAYRLDLMADFVEGESPAIPTGEGAPFAELIDYRQTKAGDRTLVTARYVLYSFPEFSAQPDPRSHPNYEWAKDTVVNGETDGFAVEAVVDLKFYLPEEDEELQLISKKTLE